MQGRGRVVATVRLVPLTTSASHERFEFGRNWRNFVAHVDEQRISTAVQSLRTMLDLKGLHGRSFLDVGCGSGLFSLAAARLGADPIRSFDYDIESVSATETLRARYPVDASWTVERGDVTNRTYCERLGTFDIVYAWGVLHHTGAMWQAMENVAARVADEGLLFVAIYNNQGMISDYWRGVKRLFNRLPSWAQAPYAVAVMLPLELRMVAGALARRDLGSYVRGWTGCRARGMGRWHDLLDWVGGYPFEVAKPEEVFAFCRDRGFTLVELRTCRDLGCNEFVFRRGRRVGVGSLLPRPDPA
jgi:2-polyprenyl-3-methyl-5-hydroxy-6-metoxy-1,4-benzoquinol methylase